MVIGSEDLWLSDQKILRALGQHPHLNMTCVAAFVHQLTREEQFIVNLYFSKKQNHMPVDFFYFSNFNM